MRRRFAVASFLVIRARSPGSRAATARLSDRVSGDGTLDDVAVVRRILGGAERATERIVSRWEIGKICGIMRFVGDRSRTCSRSSHEARRLALRLELAPDKTFPKRATGRETEKMVETQLSSQRKQS